MSDDNNVIAFPKTQKFIVQVVFANGAPMTFPLESESLELACEEVNGYVKNGEVYHDIIEGQGFFINFRDVANTLVMTFDSFRKKQLDAQYAHAQQGRGGIIS